MRTYLDHNATSPLRDDLRELTASLAMDPPANAGSLHREGQLARGMLERARRAVRAALGASDGSVTFVSGATEANNLVLLGLADGDVLVVSPLEHPSVRACAEAFAERGGEVRWLDHDGRGRIALAEVERSIRGASMVTLMAANNELGNVNPVAEVAALCRAEGCRFHVDAAQVVGRLPFVVAPGMTSVTVSAHKAGGPRGVGALWLAEGVGVRPRLVGGHQERGRRAGTEDVAAAVLLAQTLSGAVADAWQGLAGHRDRLQDALVAWGGVVNGDVDARLPNTLNISFPGHPTEELIMALDLEGVAVSGGSACTAGSIDVSPVLEALGVPREVAESAVRLSLGPGYAGADEARVIAAFSRVLGRPTR